MEVSPSLNILIGPTSSGKTSLALQLCKKFGGQIISADSRQVYKYMDIGTGKLPTSSNIQVKKNEDNWEIDGTPVWGYDLVVPGSYFSAYDFAKFALKKAGELLATSVPVYVVGGTGFYLDLLLGTISPTNSGPNLKLRGELSNKDLTYLQEALNKIDPTALSKLDMSNKVRIIRAIEKLSTEVSDFSQLPYLKNISIKALGLTAPREILYSRVDAWTDSIWDKGLLTEVEGLIQNGYTDSPQMKGLVYKTAYALLQKELSESEAIQRAKYDLHAYIRRQQTYFRSFEKRLVSLPKSSMRWLDISEDNFLQKVYNTING